MKAAELDELAKHFGISSAEAVVAYNKAVLEAVNESERRWNVPLADGNTIFHPFFQAIPCAQVANSAGG